jgi:hypothetical protein
MYTVIVVMTLYFLLKRGNVWAKNRVALCYTVCLAVVTTAWYYTTARVTEVAAIEYLAPQFSSQIGIADSCAVHNMLGSTLSLLTMIGSDVVMVSRIFSLDEATSLTCAYSFTAPGTSLM